jgi:hypothetical protein
MVGCFFFFFWSVELVMNAERLWIYLEWTDQEFGWPTVVLSSSCVTTVSEEDQTPTKSVVGRRRACQTVMS